MGEDFEQRDDLVEMLHALRVQIDGSIKEVARLTAEPAGYLGATQLNMVYTKLIEAKMWAGKVIEALGDTQYPEHLKDEAK